MLLTSGLSGVSVLLGVFFKTYSDASQGEIGVLLMSFPFVSLVIKPLFCSIADRHQKHQTYLILALIIMLIGYTPFIVIPFYPEFYTKTPRSSWYLLVIACHIGSGALSVAWSLGECLAVNMAQRNGSSYSRMRLTGTISWGLVSYSNSKKTVLFIRPLIRFKRFRFYAHSKTVWLYHRSNQRNALCAKICTCLHPNAPKCTD